MCYCWGKKYIDFASVAQAWHLIGAKPLQNDMSRLELEMSPALGELETKQAKFNFILMLSPLGLCGEKTCLQEDEAVQ